MRYHVREFRYDLPKKSRKGRLIFWSTLLIVGIPLFLVTAAEAQTRASIERELEKTDAVIERAAEAVSASRNLKAESLLKMAVELQSKGKHAKEQFRYGQALDLTLKAREKAYEAIGFTKKDEENENLVLRAIERTDQAISQAQELARDMDQKRVSSLLDMAIRSQQKAKEFYREHRLKMALKLTLEARETANKIKGLAGNGERMDRLAEKQLNAAVRFLDKASVIIQESRNQSAVDLLEKAEGLLKRARELFAQNAFAKSIKDSQSARGMVEKALKLVEEDISPGTVENAIRQNERLIEKGEEAMKGSVNPEAIDIFERGLSHQSKARQYYGDGEYRAALAEAKVANRLLGKALQMVEQSG